MNPRERIISALRTVQDPEMPVNIYDLGLIYEVNVSDIGVASIVMTLTAPNCPVAGTLPGEVERALRGLPGVEAVVVELTFDPPWTKERMSPAARLFLGVEDPSGLVNIRS